MTQSHFPNNPGRTDWRYEEYLKWLREAAGPPLAEHHPMKHLPIIRHLRWTWAYLTYWIMFHTVGKWWWRQHVPEDFQALEDIWYGKD